MRTSPLNMLIQGMRKYWTLLNEIFLNIDTEHSGSGPGSLLDLPDSRGIYSDKAVNQDNLRYDTMDYFQIRRIIDVLNPGVDDSFYDLGCGKGRILCLAARRSLKKVTGIDLFEDLCMAARNNALRLRGKKTPIDVICADVTTVDYTDATIFFLFNPFGETTLRAVIRCIEVSLQKKPRRIRIVYANPVHEYVLVENAWLERFTSLKTLGGMGISFWQSREHANTTN